MSYNNGNVYSSLQLTAENGASQVANAVGNLSISIPEGDEGSRLTLRLSADGSYRISYGEGIEVGANAVSFQTQIGASYDLDFSYESGWFLDKVTRVTVSTGVPYDAGDFFGETEAEFDCSNGFIQKCVRDRDLLILPPINAVEGDTLEIRFTALAPIQISFHSDILSAYAITFTDSPEATVVLKRLVSSWTLFSADRQNSVTAAGSVQELTSSTLWADVPNGARLVYIGASSFDTFFVVDSVKTGVTVHNAGAGGLYIADVADSATIRVMPGQTVVFNTVDEGDGRFSFDETARFSGVVLPNGSLIREGTTDAGLGGNKGIAQVCSVGYELKWEAGRLYVMNQDGFTIRQSLYNLAVPPTATDDTTKGFVVGSLWTLDDGSTYRCTDAEEFSAAWEVVGADWPAITNKPAVIAAGDDVDEARTAIDLGPSQSPTFAGMTFDGDMVQLINGSYAVFTGSSYAVFNTDSSANFNAGSAANFNAGSAANFDDSSSAQFSSGGYAQFNSESSAQFKNGSNLVLEGRVTEIANLRSGAGVILSTSPVCKLTSTGAAQAITLANGTDGQKLTLVHAVDGGSMVLTATTKTGWTTSITFTNAGDNVVLQFFDTIGWVVLSSRGATVL